MTIIKYHPDIPIVNLDAMSPGVNARYLECIHNHDQTAIIAKCWRRVLPETAEVIIDFYTTVRVGESQ